MGGSHASRWSISMSACNPRPGDGRRAPRRPTNGAVDGQARRQPILETAARHTLYLLPASRDRDKDALTGEGVARHGGSARELRLDRLRQPGRHRARRPARLRHADVAVVVANPEILLVRDSAASSASSDAKTEKAERGECMEASAAHPLRRSAGRARADAQGRRRLEILSILLGIAGKQAVLNASNVGWCR